MRFCEAKNPAVNNSESPGKKKPKNNPTIIDKNYDVMKYMVASGHSKYLVVQTSTNLTKTKKDFYSLLPHFKSIIFLASIDGVGPIQEYMRYPSKWNQIESNLKKVPLLLLLLNAGINPAVNAIGEGLKEHE